jgi:hypothetical protein
MDIVPDPIVIAPVPLILPVIFALAVVARVVRPPARLQFPPIESVLPAAIFFGATPEKVRFWYEGAAEIVCPPARPEIYATVVPVDMFRAAKAGQVVAAVAEPRLNVPDIKFNVPVDVT